MSETIGERPIDGEIGVGAVSRDLDDVTLPPEASPTADTVLESAMATGEDEGTPGEREPVDPEDSTAIAVQDDAPLPAGDPGSSTGGPQDDGLAADFREPPD